MNYKSMKPCLDTLFTFLLFILLDGDQDAGGFVCFLLASFRIKYLDMRLCLRLRAIGDRWEMIGDQSCALDHLCFPEDFRTAEKRVIAYTLHHGIGNRILWYVQPSREGLGRNWGKGFLFLLYSFLPFFFLLSFFLFSFFVFFFCFIFLLFRLFYRTSWCRSWSSEMLGYAARVQVSLFFIKLESWGRVLCLV